MVAKPTEELTVSSITFISEQDGDIERALKALIVPILSQDLTVSAAYLVRVCYGECNEQKVAIALDCPPSRQLVEQVGNEFRKMFNNKESLDFVFLDDLKRKAISSVAKPFSQQNAHSA